MRTLYNARVGLLTPLALPGERKRFLGMVGSCEWESKGEETFGMRRTGQKKEANDFRKRAASKPFVLSGMTYTIVWNLSHHRHSRRWKLL
jgi:hypothetical protein